MWSGRASLRNWRVSGSSQPTTLSPRMQELFFHHNDIRLCYERIGSAGDPLLLMTGLAADKHYWHDDFCATLVENGFHNVAPQSRISRRGVRMDCPPRRDRQ